MHTKAAAYVSRGLFKRFSDWQGRRKLRYKRLLNSAKQTVWQKFRKKIKNDMSDMRKFNISYVNFIAKVII